MSKKKRPKKRKKVTHSQVLQKLLNPNQVNITKEANYIIGRAQEMESRVISLGALVFFSSDTGDAWILDPEDNYALCLARAGDRQELINEP